ncbi:uncharacterized protein B0P05DRAFT_457504, partial [Gilbertella persicaria]|uniref:uncharacterized protein n=1 Tax=Gilbertella persicaria TaxID=101096 RepID=UPI00221EC4C3
MSSLTEALKKLLNEKVSFPSLLKGREIHDRNDAKNTMGAAIKNLKKKKEIISQVEDLEKDWQDFLNSTEADVFFES